MLGLPETPVDEDDRVLLNGYFGYFCTRMADIIRTGVSARVVAECGTTIPGSTPVVGKLARWKRRRGVREMWSNRSWTVSCFRALRLNALLSWRRDAPLPVVTGWWRLREAFELWCGKAEVVKSNLRIKYRR